LSRAREAQGSGFIASSDGNADMKLSMSECRRFAQECRDLAKSAKTVKEMEFLREREASWIKLAKEAESKRVRTVEMV
jgi:cold shock CspA family protein